jgi:hypothetical protein
MTRNLCCPLAALLAPAALLTLVSPAWGASDRVASALDWSARWSAQRWAFTAVCVLLAWILVFLVLFPNRLGHWRRYASAPWPRDAFGQALAFAVLLTVCSFLLFFAWLEDELRPAGNPLHLFPSSMTWLNLHGRWLGILVLGIVAALLIMLLIRHREPARKAARS